MERRGLNVAGQHPRQLPSAAPAAVPEAAAAEQPTQRSTAVPIKQLQAAATWAVAERHGITRKVRRAGCGASRG